MQYFIKNFFDIFIHYSSVGSGSLFCIDHNSANFILCSVYEDLVDAFNFNPAFTQQEPHSASTSLVFQHHIRLSGGVLLSPPDNLNT